MGWGLDFQPCLQPHLHSYLLPEQVPSSPRGPAFSALPPTSSASHLPKRQPLFPLLLLLPSSLSFLFHQYLVSLQSFLRGFENKQLNACDPSSTFSWQTGVCRAGAEGQGEVRGWAPEPGVPMAELWLHASIPLCVEAQMQKWNELYKHSSVQFSGGGESGRDSLFDPAEAFSVSC